MKKLILILILFIPLNISAFESSAASVILMDQESKRILYGNNIHDIRSVASISKIMTAILAIESNDLEKTITVGNEIDKAYGSNVYLKKTEKIKLIDLIYGLMLRSGNDASLVIAKNVSADFIKLMNDKAKEIGMKNTTFNNPNGLDTPKSNYSTAYDMALLMSYAMKNKTFEQIVSTKKHRVKTNLNYYEWTNKNKLLFTYKYITGGKTGFTDVAKRTLVTTARKNNLNLVVVTLNDGNDFLDHKNLYEEAFKEYKKYRILKKGSINIIEDNYFEKNTLYLKQNIYYPLTKSEAENIVLNFKLNKKAKQNDVGEVSIKLDDKVLYQEKIYYKKIKRTFIDKLLGWLNGK